jgi:hypothetical protein
VRAGAVEVKADDLAGVVDAGCNSVVHGTQWIVEGGVDAAAQQESVLAAGVVKRPHDLAGVVDANRHGVAGLHAG